MLLTASPGSGHGCRLPMASVSQDKEPLNLIIVRKDLSLVSICFIENGKDFPSCHGKRGNSCSLKKLVWLVGLFGCRLAFDTSFCYDSVILEPADTLFRLGLHIVFVVKSGRVSNLQKDSSQEQETDFKSVSDLSYSFCYCCCC